MVTAQNHPLASAFVRANRWPLFAAVLGLAFAGTLHAQDPWLRTNSTVVDDHERRLDELRERGDAIRRRLDEENRERQERMERDRRKWEEEREERETELRSESERRLRALGTYGYRPSGYSSRVNDAEDYEKAGAESEERERQEQQDAEDGFAAASGKCGDVTTQRIGNFFYHSDGTVTQKIGNFFYGSDGQVTQKIGNFYYDSDGGVTQKIGSFYYHSGGKSCEDQIEE